MLDPCPFCHPSPAVFFEDRRVRCLWDRFPVTEGHALVVPVRHVSTWFEATRDEQVALLDGIEEARRAIEARWSVDGFNIGINVGEAGGQTVPHLHVHVIPRRRGDVSRPRGGVRWVIPEKADYLSDQVRESSERLYRALVPSEAILGDVGNPFGATLLDDLSTAVEIRIAVAFVLRRGLEIIAPRLQECLDRGGRVSFLTGDYFDVTEPEALRVLLDLTPEGGSGTFEARCFETDRTTGFHPKAYAIRTRGSSSVAYVGSSNLSVQALERGVEWNYRVDAMRDPDGYQTVEAQFDQLFRGDRTRPLTPEWIASYEARRSPPSGPRVVVEVASEPPEDPPRPHPIQEQALAALEATRAVGNPSGLVVLATGLGKTWLAAFDSRTFDRVLFVAHREEILRQALKTFRRIRPHASLGYLTGFEKHVEADVVFASIQTLSRSRHLERFDREDFDYIVVDEFHHAEAETYRRVIDYFNPKFLLGLTATPDRTDGADLLSLTGQNLVFECGLFEGIRAGLLCPFQYFGVPDEVDFEQIPWRNGRFSEGELESAVETQSRADNALDQWRTHAGPGSRCLAFCVSRRHADFMRDHFGQHGVAVASVHSGESSDPREQSLDRLRAGRLEVIFCVDMFNEGVDVPQIDCVLMLRPTESRIVWIQQIGRGLRVAEGKTALTIVDYIGNHHTFLKSLVLLASEVPGASDPKDVLAACLEGRASLPPGCGVTYDLEAVRILEGVLASRRPRGALGRLDLWYQDFRERNGRRPTMTETWQAGHDPKITRSKHGSYLGFVAGRGDLGESATEFERHREFLERLERTEMTRSYKMVVLLALLRRQEFPGSLAISDLVTEVRAIAASSAPIELDLGSSLQSDAALRSKLEEMPIDRWVQGRGMGNQRYFSYEEGRFATTDALRAEEPDALAELAREVCEFLLATYLKRSRAERRFIVQNDAGDALDARFSLERHEGGFAVVMESAGGTRGTPQARNSDYAAGLEVLLRRLASMGAVLERVELASTNADGQQLEVKGYELPLALESVSDSLTLRRAISRSQGNNPERRIRLLIQTKSALPLEQVAARLSTP